MIKKNNMHIYKKYIYLFFTSDINNISVDRVNKYKLTYILTGRAGWTQDMD